MHTRHLNEVSAMPHQRTNFADGLVPAKRGRQQTHRMQILKPLAIEDVGLATGNVMHMLSIDQMDINAPRFQDLKQRYPVHAGRFHSHRVHSALLQPVRQGVQILRKGRKRSHRFGVPIGGYGNKDFRRSNINTAGVWSHYGQTSLQFSMLSFVCLCHGSPPLMVRQRARRARFGNLFSGIIATQNSCCASPMLWRTGLGSNSQTGSPKQAPMGYTIYAYRCREGFLKHVTAWTGPCQMQSSLLLLRRPQDGSGYSQGTGTLRMCLHE